jgi:protein SCO1/2
MDPERGEPVNLRLYMESFGARFLGLTGSPKSVADAAKSFKVQVERLQFSADPNDYAMTHVSPIFLMRPGDRQPLSLPPESAPDVLEAAFKDALQTEPR